MGQEETVRTRHGTTGWFKTGKGIWQGCILSPCVFNFYEEYITRNAKLDEAQAGIKIALAIPLNSIDNIELNPGKCSDIIYSIVM